MNSVSLEARRYLSGLAENYSFSGKFLGTQKHLGKGDVVELSFRVPGGPPATARAVVRWAWRVRKPTGVGLEFIEFDRIGDWDFHVLVESIFDA